MRLDQRLYDAAKTFLDQRFPEGEGGVAAMYTDDGELLLSTSPETINDGTILCHEVGALCEAYKKNKRIVATICLYRESADLKPTVLAPCGICQERLMIYGDAVECAVAKENPCQFEVRSLKELQPHNWRLAFEKKPVS
jgi:cytidine deaminase